MGEKAKGKRNIIIIGILLGAILITEIALAIWLPLRYAGDTAPGTVKSVGENSKICPNAAVAADSAICSSLGREILEQGGNAVDSVITTALCSGVQNMHSCGIGGGSFLVIHDPDQDVKRFINCRETAPAFAFRDMYKENPSDSSYGPKSIGIPGEMKCMSVAHEKFGKLEWSKLIDPIVKLVRNGVFVTQASSSAITDSRIASIIGNKEIFLNPDGRVKQQGDQVANEKLAITFEAISQDRDAFYKLPLAQAIVDDINEAGGNFTLEDILNYEVDEVEPIQFKFLDYIGYVGPPPSSGAVLAFIVNIMAHFKENGELPTTQTDDFFHKLAEAYKFAYGKRSLLGDRFYQPDREEFDELISNLTSFEYAKRFYEKIEDNVLEFEEYEPAYELVEDAGTSHMSVVDKNGMTCALTSTINTFLGSKVVGSKTGIIFNNEMDDFSSPGFNNVYGVPPSPQNFIEAGKRPLSSMAPVVITDKSGNFVYTGGASGGTKITTAVAGIITKTLMMDMDLNKATQEARVHHQLMPMKLTYDARMNQNISAQLMARGHEVGISNGAVCQSIQRKNGELHAVSDSRKGGVPDGY